MNLTDPRESLAEQSSFIAYLMGLAGAAKAVRALAAETDRPTPVADADEFVHVLLGLAALGAAVERLAPHGEVRNDPSRAPVTPARWLR